MNNFPPVTKNLLIINIAVFLLSQLIPSMNDLLALHYIQASHFKAFQFITYMFMHGGFTHLFFNMFALWMFGLVMERTWGSQRFLVYYMVCGIGAGICQELTQAVQVYNLLQPMGGDTLYNLIHLTELDPTAPATLNTWCTVGASGSIYGILLAFGMTYPEERMFIIPIPFPIKAKWMVMGYAVIEIVSAMSSSADGIAHMAHLGGMLFGFFLIRYWRHIAEQGKTHFTGWDNYSQTDNGGGIFTKIRNAFKISRGKLDEYNRDEKKEFTSTSTHQQDWDYNARQKAEDDEIDRILEKIRRCGYAGLTKEEKQKLFDASRK